MLCFYSISRENFYLENTTVVLNYREIKIIVSKFELAESTVCTLLYVKYVEYVHYCMLSMYML